MTVYADGALLNAPAHSFVAGEGIPLSLYHIGFRYGLYTSASYSFNGDNASLYAHEDTGNYPTDVYLTYGAVNSNDVAKFGSTSLKIPNINAALVFPTPLEVATTGNFTFEFWVYPTSAIGTLLLFSSDTNDDLLSQYNGVLTWRGNSASAGLSTGVWTHIAVSRYGSIVRMFKNGVKILEMVDSAAVTIHSIRNVASGDPLIYFDSFGFSDNYAHYKDTFQTPILPFYVEPTTGGVVLSPYTAQFVPGEAAGSSLTPSEYDPHWKNVVLLLSGNGTHGTTNFAESKNRFIRNILTVVASNAQTKYHSTSIQFSGLNRLRFSPSCELSLMYGDFTIETWYYPQNLTVDRTIASSCGDRSYGGWWLYTRTDGKPAFGFKSTDASDTVLTSSVAMTANQWAHLAVTRTGNVYRLFLNGVMVASVTSSKIPDPYSITYVGSYVAAYLNIGGHSAFALDYGAKGFIEDFRITNGVSRYAADGTFAVPATGFVAASSGADGDPYWNDVEAIVHFDEQVGTTYNIRDGRGHTVTPYLNSAVVDASEWNPAGYAQDFYLARCGNGLYVSGTGATGFSLNYGPEFDFSSGDFTIELWCDVSRNILAPIVSMIHVDTLNPTNNRGWALCTTGDGILSSEEASPSGSISWKQYDASGVSDIAISNLDCLVARRWHHIAVVRCGDDLQIFVDGKGGLPYTITRRPANLGESVLVGYATSWFSSQVGTDYIDSVRITRAARYKGDFLPPAGKLPEYLYTFGYALISETTSLIPGSPKAAATVPGATVSHAYKLEIPKVVAPTFGFNESVPVAATATGGEGGNGNMLFIEDFTFRQTYREQHNLYFADEAVIQNVTGTYDDLTLSSTVAVALGNVSVVETPSFSAALAGTARLYTATTDAILIGELTRLALHVGAGETIGIATMLALAKHASQRDTTYFNDTHDTLFTFDIDTVEALGLTSATEYGKGWSLTEAFTLGSTVATVRSVPVSISSIIDVSSSTTATVYLQVSADDTMALDAAFTPNQLLDALVEEAVAFDAFMSCPSYTTWVMNTRSTAVSQYEGYQFNSFAKVGERYLGANDSGLFWLDGDTDAGTPVLTTVQPGIVQPHGNKLARVLYAYLGMRGDGAFTFTVTDEAGGSYVYKLDAESMKTGRVSFGKGMRTRYFTFKIESDGQDYDLDNIEFVTTETSRKVQR